MLITCVCPTYGRVPYDRFMLEECVYWFTRQTHPDRELLIVNDAAEQTIVCHAPGVRVVNLSRRFATLGAKYNYACRIAAGDVVAPWEDDDISLPHRLSQLAEKLDGFEYWKPGGEFFQNGRMPDAPLAFCSPGNVFHNGSGFRKSLWSRGCRYPEESGPQDAGFDRLAYQTANVNRDRPIDPAAYSYVYRWQHGTGRQPNLSGHGDPGRAYADRPPPVSGVYVIEPVMHADYVALTRV